MHGEIIISPCPVGAWPMGVFHSPWPCTLDSRRWNSIPLMTTILSLLQLWFISEPYHKCKSKYIIREPYWSIIYQFTASSCESTLTVIFSHQREDLEVESRTRRTCSSPFNMQLANQPKSTGPINLGDANFDCKYVTTQEKALATSTLLP
jgi:hypothetical protein